MFEFAAVLSLGGIVYWSNCSLSQTHLALINEFVTKVLIESLQTPQPYISSNQQQAVQWLVGSNRRLLFIICYANQLDTIRKSSYASILETLSQLDLSDIVAYSPPPPHVAKSIQYTFNTLLSNIAAQRTEKPQVIGKQPAATPAGAKQETKQPKKPKKANRKWGMSGIHGNDEEDPSVLDFGEVGPFGEHQSSPAVVQDENLNDTIPDLHYAASNSSNILLSSLWGKFNEITGFSKTLSKENLASSLDILKESLTRKNVAGTVAEKVCSSVEARLVGQQITAFSTSNALSSTIRDATSSIIQQIFTSSDDPRFSSDIFLGMAEAREQRRPFIITLVGVNGVGKSTTLSKLVYWTLQRKFRVLVVAGDTFRSGAVEQLSIHVKNLSKIGSVALFERGYGKDISSVAREAIQHARSSNSYDVIFIDTAGRMQDNAPLMRSLGQMVATTSPDRIVFVGEALVGNEAIDQLTKFNAALVANSHRTIDGIVLTKFDTIDDKVGAAVSMAYISGAPILFVGMGQTYLDLRRLNVDAVVDALLQ